MKDNGNRFYNPYLSSRRGPPPPSPSSSRTHFIVHIIKIQRLRPRTRLHHRNIIHALERIRQHGLNHLRRERSLRRSKRKARRRDLLPITLPKPGYQNRALREYIRGALLRR